MAEGIVKVISGYTPQWLCHSSSVGKGNPLASFPSAVIKYSDKSNLRMERFSLGPSSRYSPRQQELETPGHLQAEDWHNEWV